MTKEVEANNKKLTPEYLRYMSIISLSNNTKFYFGESIPKYFSTNIEKIEGGHTNPHQSKQD
jgi:hypothetical protein